MNDSTKAGTHHSAYPHHPRYLHKYPISDTMAFQYRFYHTCGHFGLGPIIHNAPSQPHSTDSTSDSSDASSIPRTIQTSLTFTCPFCSEHPPDVPDGEGVLAILSSSTTSPFPNTWRIIRICTQEDIKPEEWPLAHRPGGIYRHMAWVPNSCGEVEIIQGEDEATREADVEYGVTTHVSCRWKQRRGERFRSRFAGLRSQMGAALMYGENARR